MKVSSLFHARPSPLVRPGVLLWQAAVCQLLWLNTGTRIIITLASNCARSVVRTLSNSPFLRKLCTSPSMADFFAWSMGSSDNFGFLYSRETAGSPSSDCLGRVASTITSASGASGAIGVELNWGFQCERSPKDRQRNQWRTIPKKNADGGAKLVEQYRVQSACLED